MLENPDKEYWLLENFRDTSQSLSKVSLQHIRDHSNALLVLFQNDCLQYITLNSLKDFIFDRNAPRLKMLLIKYLDEI